MCHWNVDWGDNLQSVIEEVIMKSNLPVPSEISPKDRHHVRHHIVGRPQLVQGAVLVVDPLQENLESWYREKSCTIGTGWWALDKRIFWKHSRRRTTPCPLCSSALSPAWAKKDGHCKMLVATILENCKRSFSPLPLLPPLPCLPQDAHNLYSSSPSKPRFKLQKSWNVSQSQRSNITFVTTVKSTLIIFCSPVGEVLQAPPIVTSHVQVDLLHCCHHPDSLRFAGVYCLHDRSQAIDVPLVHQNPRNGQELAQDGNIACVTGVVQSCPVVVLGVHLNARLCQQQVHHLLVVSPYCLHQTGPVVTSSLGVGVSPSEKKFPGHLQLAKAATLPQIVLMGSHRSLIRKIFRRVVTVSAQVPSLLKCPVCSAIRHLLRLLSCNSARWPSAALSEL